MAKANFQKVVDEIADEVQKTVREVQANWRKTWKPRLSHSGPVREARTFTHEFKQMPARLSDLAAEGGCAMRYFLGFGLKGYAAMQGLGGLILASIAFTKASPWNSEEFSIGLVLLVTAQMFWWGGALINRSADRKRYAQYQHRLLKLAREKDGNLTVLEAATDGRMTVEKAEEILRELSARGHAEMRVSESGLIVYYFPEIARWEEKHWARPVDEL